METEKTIVLNEWLEKAQHDLNAAAIIFKHLPDHIDTVAFHCQQSAEKYLKALLFYLDIDIVKTHDLILISNMLSDKINIADELFEKLAKPNFYSVEIRYPQGRYKPNHDEIMQAITDASKIREFVLEQISAI